MNAIVQHSSKTVEHYTPPHIVKAARQALGGRITLDPASCALANRTVMADHFFSEDGLLWVWGSESGATVFLNPPGGRRTATSRYPTKSVAAMWWMKLAREYDRWAVHGFEAVFVGFTLEILRSAQGLGVASPLEFPFCVPSSRLQFLSPAGSGDELRVGKQPAHANVIVYLGDHVDRFVDAFGEIGEVRR